METEKIIQKMDPREQIINAFRLELDKWLKHSVRGMKSGNPAYFQGKITLIHDLLAFLYDVDFRGETLPRFIAFCLKSAPGVRMVVPESLVHEELDGWSICYLSEYGSLQTMVLLSREWEKEDRA